MDDAESSRISRRAILAGGAGLLALGGLAALEIAAARAAWAAPSWRHPFTARGTIPYGGHFGSWILNNGSARQNEHTGLDYSPPTSGPIYSIASGVVSVVTYSASWGNYVYVDHADGYRSAYAHMANGSVQVSLGQTIQSSTHIGNVGATGNPLTGTHLHLVVRHHGVLVDPQPLVHYAPLAQPGVPDPQSNMEGEDMGVVFFAGSGTYTTQATGSHPGGTVVGTQSMWFQECPGAPLFAMSGGTGYLGTSVVEEYEAHQAGKSGQAKAYNTTATKIGQLIELRGVTPRPIGNFV